MSEQEQMAKETSLEEVPDLAATYLDAIKTEPDQERLDEIKSEIDELESKRSEVANNAGEDSFLIEEIGTKIQKLKDEHEEISESAEEVIQRHENLLQAAADHPGFQVSEHWLNPDVLRALTHALYGTKEEEVVVADQVLREPDDAEGLEWMQEFQIKREIMNIARDQISTDERVAERWEEFEGTSAHRAFRAIAREPGLGPSEIAETQDDTSTSAVRNWTSDLANQEELKMVYTSTQRDYHLSTVGKYYATHYADLSDSEPSDTVDADEAEEIANDSDVESAGEDAESTESTNDSEQLNLGNSDEDTDDQSNGVAPTDQGVTSSEADTTEEKAKAMFENIGEEDTTSK
jgi:hypothetical protein